MKTNSILKGLGLLLLSSACCCTASGVCQEMDAPVVDSTTSITADETTNYNDLPSESQEKEVTKKGDTTYVSFGKKKIRIIEQNGTTDVKITDKEDGDEDKIDWATDEECEELFSDKEKEEKKPWQEFKGHWAGMEFGLSNYMTGSGSLQLPNEYDFMNLRTGRSWNVNLNFAQQSLGFGSDRIGIVTGMGLEWSNYHFDSDIPIYKNSEGIIAADSANARDNRLKNRFQTTYLTVPLILEWQFTGGDYDDRSYIGVGVIGGVNLFANTMMKYVEDGDKKKEKLKGGYNLAPIRYAFTARAGFKALKLYANYSPVALFQKDEGPELYPIAAGLVVSF